MKMKKILLITLLFLFSCGDKQQTSVSTTKAKPENKQQPPLLSQDFDVNKSSFQLEVSKYTYDGLSYRDPFLPVSPEKIAKAKLGSEKEAMVPGLGSLQLKGFVVDAKDKIALFNSPYGRYLLVNGKLYDNQNRLVKGFSGKIVYDSETNKPKGVILVTSENEYKEYILSKQE